MSTADLKGYFEAVSETVRYGGSIWIRLVVVNEGDGPIVLSLPHGRVNGISIRVVKGEQYEVVGMETEIEPGFVGERTLHPSESCSKLYKLSDWLIPGSRTEYEVECSVALETHAANATGIDGESLNDFVVISTVIKLNVI